MHFNLVEMFPGLGTLTAAIVKGLRKQGSVGVNGAAELTSRYLQLFSRQHSESSTACGDITKYAPEELSFARAEGILVLIAGIPCTGASVAGRSKNGLAAPEEHPEVGHLFIPTLHWILRHRPHLAVFENVPPYANTFSAQQIRQTLTAAGYTITERIVNPLREFGCPTERCRWVAVASRIGSFSWVYEANPFTGTLAEYLDAPSERDAADEATPAQVAADSKYIARKQSEGCGFAMRLIDVSSTKCPTIPKSYGKRQPSATFVKTANSYRMLRPLEVCRIHHHGPEIAEVIAALPATIAYEVLGQGVVARPFENLGEALGRFAGGAKPELPVGQLELFAAA